MTIVGFNFTRMLIEKNEVIKGKIHINNNITIKNVEETDLSQGKNKQKGIKFTYLFTSKYEPKIGFIEIAGEVYYMVDDKKRKEILSSWKKDNKLPKETMTSILNTVLAKCNIQAIILSKDLNLPPPIPLPKVESKTVTDDYIG